MSIKSAGSCRQKPKNLKNFYLLFSHRFTPITNRESTTIFDSNVHVRPIIEGCLFPSLSLPRVYPRELLTRLAAGECWLTCFSNLIIYVPISHPFYLFPYPFSLLRSRHLYICRELSTNQLFLCKTNPISEKPI
jgi:hypothetical protein